MLVEYPAVARKVAQEIGMDMFDDTTYQPHRLMYWPSTSFNGEFIFRVLDGDVVNPDYYLGLYDNWRDVSTWPVSSRESEAVKKQHHSRRIHLQRMEWLEPFAVLTISERQLISF